MKLTTHVDELIALTEKKLILLRELRHAFDLAERAGVHPNEIDRSGYDPKTDERLTHLPARRTQGMKPVTNYVILKDGRRIDLPIEWRTEKEKMRQEALNAAKLPPLS